MVPRLSGLFSFRMILLSGLIRERDHETRQEERFNFGYSFVVISIARNVL